MCSPATCSTCGKVTWSGCGRHVDQVMARVPVDRRCTCSTDPSRGAASRRRGIFRR
jgi:hypothetical protein